jgi:hypothetical protein
LRPPRSAQQTWLTVEPVLNRRLLPLSSASWAEPLDRLSDVAPPLGQVRVAYILFRNFGTYASDPCRRFAVPLNHILRVAFDAITNPSGKQVTQQLDATQRNQEDRGK